MLRLPSGGGAEVERRYGGVSPSRFPIPKASDFNISEALRMMQKMSVKAASEIVRTETWFCRKGGRGILDEDAPSAVV